MKIISAHVTGKYVYALAIAKPMIMNTTSDSPIESPSQLTGKVALAKQAVDELALQLSLGKADARDKFEEIKKEFRTKLQELRARTQQKAMVDLLARIVELEAVLLAGKVDSARAFDSQRRALISIMKNLEDAITEKFSEVPAVIEFTHEIEILRLKLLILRLKFTLKTFKIKKTFHLGMDKAIDMVRSADSKVRTTRDHYRQFRGDVRRAYRQMEKAIRNL